MTRLHIAVLVVLVFALGVAVASPAGDNIVINEIYCDGAGFYDGSEFIELYNPTGAPIDVNGWVLTGVEYNETCGGEDLWQFPLAPPDITILPGGYLVVAKDGDESSVPESDDSFYWEFGIYPDFEQYDADAYFEIDGTTVPNMILLTNETATNYSDEIQLIGGRGYGIVCTSPTSDADVVYLYDGDPSSGPANLVDLIEYIDPLACPADPCVYPFTDDGADDNAFLGIPFLGNSLGRDTSGTDTDMSVNDWTMQAPTPKAQNVPNTPPWIRTLTYAPIPPNEIDDTLVSAYVTDDAVIDSVMVYYRVNGGSWGKVAATTSDSLYTGAVPALGLYDGDVVDYFMRAVDDLGAVMNYPSEAMSRPYSYRIGITPIYNVQFVSAGGDTSAFDGTPVNVQGIVTMGTGVMDDDTFYIHDGVGEFRGIACYMGGELTPVQEGDLVTFCGRVSEYYDLTEITRHFEGSMVIESSGNPHYGYTDVTTAQVTYNNIASEPYEAQLVRVTDATVTLESGAFGIWYCADSSILNAKVDDEAYYTYDAEVGDVLTELRGILLYDYSEYKIQPRDDDDILGPPRISDVRYSPVPPAAGVTTTISATLDDNVGISSATLHWSLSEARPYPNTVPMSAAKYSGTWEATIPGQPAGARVYYYIDCADASGMDAERPSAGGYGYYTGTTTIQSVQEVPPGGDASPMDTLAVNVEGYVTVEPGVFNDNSFYIQEASGAWHGILVYDGSGTASFERGDYVVCCGEVDEYFGMTELSLHFAEAAQITAAKGDMVEPASIATGMLQNVVSAEQFESVFVEAEDCTVYDADLGFGEWAISNGTATDTCRVDDYADYDYVPVNGDNVYVRGVVQYVYGNYKIEPRGNEDIAINPVGISNSFGGKFGLAQNVPNPFNPKTTIAFNLTEAGDVTLEVYDVAGRRVATLIDRHMGAGVHQANWDGMTSEGERAASGVYFYKLATGDQKTSRKMVLLK